MFNRSKRNFMRTCLTVLLILIFAISSLGLQVVNAASSSFKNHADSPQVLQNKDSDLALAAKNALAAGPTCTVKQDGSGDYTTIQAAVNDVNCTNISIAAGYYYERISISRDVTIVGAGENLTYIDGIGSSSFIYRPITIDCCTVFI